MKANTHIGMRTRVSSPIKGKIRNHSNDVQPTKGTTQRNQISHTIFPFAIYNYNPNIFLHRKVFVWNKCTIYCWLLKPTIEEPSLMCTLWSWRARDSPQTTMQCDNCIKNTITIQSANLCTALDKKCRFSLNSIRYMWIADTNFVQCNYLSKATCLVPLIVPHATIFNIIFNYSEKHTKETRYSCPAKCNCYFAEHHQHNCHCSHNHANFLFLKTVK